jgi:uncharacterized cupredoxin-like copper-binding protein
VSSRVTACRAERSRDGGRLRHRLRAVISARVAPRLVQAGFVIGVVAVVGSCDAGAPPATPPISPGTVAAPREVNIIAKDWQFLPDPVDLVPGETVVLHIVNGGLEIHEVVIGDGAVQDAWERAEAAAADPPPGPTPVVSVPPELAGLRVVVPSGQRIDVEWTVPAVASSTGSSASGWSVGCHIPGHWAKGMVVPIRFVRPGAAP